MMRWLEQWWCPHMGKTIAVPLVRQRQGEPDFDATICCDCGKVLVRSWTDNAGTEVKEST
jgi:hypothetical protein